MADHLVRFDDRPEPVGVATGTLLVEAARLADVEIQQPCGGQGRCGRCAVKVLDGAIRARSTLRLSPADLEAGYALACQAVVEGDSEIEVPPAEAIERRLTTDHVAPDAVVPAGYDPVTAQTIRRVVVGLSPPTMDDQTDDWARLTTALRREAGVEAVDASLDQIRGLGEILRSGEWSVSVTLDTSPGGAPRLIRIRPAAGDDDGPWGVAIDIGTTTVTVWLVDLSTGEVVSQAAEYNRQISRGEDVISRIIYSGKGDNAAELRDLVLESINGLLETACAKPGVDPADIVKATISGNSTMTHLLLGIPASSIRLEPFVTAVNHPPLLRGAEVGLVVHADASVDTLPGVASYVGADITAGVLASGVRSSDQVTLFIDVGTNGEIVLGSADWLVTCACSAGPAFEGAGVVHGMRADRGAIEEVWIDGDSHEPSTRVIGNSPARGICGSGLISLISEMFLTGILDKRGQIDLTLDTPRTRTGEHGPEYVVAWADETDAGEDISVTRVDIDNLLRAKAAIYAGFNVLADRVGVPLEAVERVLIGGSFGKYINVEKAVDIGLLPDMPWERFEFLGNTSVRGAYLALVDRAARAEIGEIASAMTYIELSADNTFYDAFTSALFLPHTDLSRFPFCGGGDFVGRTDMYIIGENIHIMSPKVKEALAARDADFFRASAEAQVAAGAQALDLNLGPRKKDWEEVFPWIVQAVESVVDVPLSLDSTNIAGIEAGLKVITKAQPIINSTSAEEERLEAVPLLAKKYNAKLVALTMGKSGIPVSADERVTIAIEQLIPRMLEIDYPITDLIIDPLVLTVSGCQEYCPELIGAVRTLQVVWDPPPAISVGLSNVSNAVPNENRPLINQVYCAMLMGVGLEMMIADPFDEGLMEVVRIIEERDESTSLSKLYLSISDRIAAMEAPTVDDVDLDDPQQAAIWKTVQILLNDVIYADSYLQQ